MKHWHETLAIARRIRDASQPRDFAVATVVRIDGSAYRRPGAKLLVDAGGDMLGAVSGGCLEADVREVGLAAMRDGRSCTRRYDTGTDEETVWGLGLGCEGHVELYVQPITEATTPVWRAVGDLLEGEDAFAIATVTDGPGTGRSLAVTTAGIAAGTTGEPDLDAAIARAAAALIPAGSPSLQSIGAATLFLDLLVPPPRLAIFGAGDDAMPLARVAAGTGFRVAVVDHRPAFLTGERFPAAAPRLIRRSAAGLDGLPLGADDAAVVMMHALEHDREWVRALAASDVGYIGVLGPRDRIARIRDAVGGDAGGRIYGPVGLDIGADGAEEIALSILAEVLAVRSRREPRHLRQRATAIHA